MSQKLPIHAAPVIVDEPFKVGDLIHTAWYRGKEGRRWEAAFPLIAQAEQIIEDEVRRRVAEAITQGESLGIYPPETAPLDGTRVDLWAGRGSSLSRYPGADYGWSRSNGDEKIYEWRVMGANGRYAITSDIVGWSPIPVFPAEDKDAPGD